jgi:hypothetical protein
MLLPSTFNHGVHTGHLNLGSMLFLKILYLQMFGYCVSHSVILSLRYEFHTILIILYIPVYIIILICIHIVPYIFEEVYSTLYMSSTHVAP